MAELKLVKNGVFPVLKHGKTNPETGFQVAGIIQGEGKLAGTPSLFVRTSGCNLSCAWLLPDGNVSYCDTPYSSIHAEEPESMSVDAIMDTVKKNLGELQHVVITGGEPMLQAHPLSVLCYRLKKELNVHITLETNGTLYDEELTDYIDLFSLSPKLKNAFLGWTNQSVDKGRIKTNVLQQIIDRSKAHSSDFQLKFVVSNSEEAGEIKAILNDLEGWGRNDVIVMPLGRTKKELKQTEIVALEMCVRNGWRYSPRLHIDFFGDLAGV